jgi:hypothetical protein
MIQSGGTTGGITNQGAYLTWNYNPSDGASYLINQQGLGTGGWKYLNFNNSNQLTANCAYLSASGGLTLGTYSNAFTAPTGGLICPGNVGIGTTSPQGKLDILGTSGITGLYVYHPTSNNSNTVAYFGSARSYSHILDIAADGIMTYALADQGSVFNSGSIKLYGASYSAVAMNFVAYNNYYGSIDVVSQSATVAPIGSPFNLVLQSSGGRVGINKTSPSTSSQMEVTASSNTIYSIITSSSQNIGAGVGATLPMLSLSDTIGGQNTIYLNFFGYRQSAGSNWTGVAQRIQHLVDLTSMGYIDFNPGNGTQGLAFGNGSTEYIRMTSGGNVGIGTTSPETKLLVKDGEITSNSASTSGQFRAVSGNYGFFIRNDGTDSYLMHTASGDPYGSYNANRPFRINNASALVTMGNGLSISGGTGYTLDVSGDINASSTLRVGGLIQPRLISSGTFTGVTSFDTVTFDLVNYNIAEIRMTVYFNTTNQKIMSSQLLDTVGTVYSATESGWQMFYGTGGVAAFGTGAYILNNTETAGNGVGGFIVVIRLIGNMGISGAVRNHWEWTTTGCYSGIGASTTYGRATPYNSSGATMNRMRFNLSGGTMTGKYSIINYST